VRLFHCDDSDSFRRLLELLVDDHEELELVGGARDRASALAGVARAQPDVVLLDAIAPDFGDDLVDELLAAAPGAKVVVYSGHPELRAEHPRVSALVSKDTPIGELAEVLRGVVGPER
jgi:DNA-binding NarL/FixJ family response regulator